MKTLAHKNFMDISHQKFGRWTVLKRGPNSKNGQTRYFCRCECGNEVLVLSLNLKSSSSKGCFNCSKKNNPKFHGMSDSHTYFVYIQMIERCHNPNHKSYNIYGNRGIFVSDRWKESFKNFHEDMGDAPDKMSIERIDNDKGYSKDNCKWEIWKNQCRNKRNSIRDGDIYKDWKVLRKLDNLKKYEIQCINCYKTVVVWSCNVRIKQRCVCHL